MSRFLKDVGDKVDEQAGEVRHVVESGREAAAAKGNEVLKTVAPGAGDAARTVHTAVAGKGGEILNTVSGVIGAGMKGGEAVAGAVASGAADITQKAQQIVTKAVRDIEAAGSRAGQTIQSAGTKAAGDIQSAAANANREINGVAARARDDIQKLLELVGSQLKETLDNLPDGSIGAVNGKKFYTPVDGYLLAVKAVHDGKPSIEIKVHEPDVVRALGFMTARNAEEFKRKMEGELRKLLRIPNEDLSKLLIGPTQTHTVAFVAEPVGATAGAVAVGDALVIAAIFAGVAGVLTASAAPILATGASIAVILLVIAILYAIHEGYDVENVEHSAGPDGRVTLKYSLKKH